MATSSEPAPGTDLYRARQLYDLGISYINKHRQTRTLEDITKAIDILKECLELTPAKHNQRAVRLRELGVAYEDRFVLAKGSDDIDAAIENFREALDLTPKGHRDRPSGLRELGVAHSHKYIHTKVLDYADNAIKYLQESVDLTPRNGVKRPDRVQQLGIVYRNKFIFNGALDALDIAIVLYQEVLDLTPEDSPERIRRLQDLGNAYRDRFDRTKSLEDIEASIQLYQEALDITPHSRSAKNAIGADGKVETSNLPPVLEDEGDYEDDPEYDPEYDDMPEYEPEPVQVPEPEPETAPVPQPVHEVKAEKHEANHEARAEIKVDPGYKADMDHQETSISIISTPQSSPHLSAQVFSINDSSHLPTITTRTDNTRPKEKEQPPVEDIMSVYSNDSYLPESGKNNSIEALAEHLTQRILSSKASKNERDKIIARLPDLLKAFASQLGYDNSDKRMYLDTMVFVRRYRQKITDSIGVRLKDHDDVHDAADQTSRPKFDVPEMSLDDRVRHWNLESSEDHERERVEEEEEDEEPEEIEWPLENMTAEQENSELEKYTKLVLDSSHFEWLLRKISRELDYQIIGPAHMEDISKFIISQHAGTEKVVRRRRPNTVRLAFSIEWSWALFSISTEKLRARGFDQDDVVSVITLEQALVLVGTADDAIATTCGEYMSMIWFEKGTLLLELLKEALLDPGTMKQKSSDSLDIGACLQDTQIQIRCEGELHAIAEVAEMLSWLSCALRPSQRNGSHIMAPSISIVEDDETHFAGDFEHYHIDSASRTSKGKTSSDCWHGMFEDVVITEGYPIPRRDKTGYGLEMSLPAIAKVLRTNRTTVRNGSIAIRDYSHALFPTSKVDNVIRWHYIFDNEGSNIPYWKAHSSDVHVSLLEMLNSRHFVGWCVQANTIAGAPGDHYDVKRSDLSPPSATMLLESFNLQGSQFVGGQLNIKFGIRRPALHIVSDGFAQKLIALRQHYVVLWDHEDKRGWLIDGLSALLHLLRTCLLASSREKFNEDLFCLDLFADIQEPMGKYPDAALHFFFKNKRLHPNMKLKIYPGEDEEKAYLVLDQVKHLCAILQDTVDQQHKMASKEGIAFSTTLRQNLLGWDFVNIATDHDFYEPLAVNLSYRGAAWVELVRSIKAVVLFGRGFGEIIEPSGGLCDYWSKLPKQEYYLASYASTVDSIIQRFGKSKATPNKLTSDLVWYNPSTVVGSSCSCQRPNSVGKHTDFSLAIWPARLQGLLPKTNSTAFWNEDSAIIFGQNKRFPWYWPNKGDPQKGKPSSTSSLAGFKDNDGNASETTLALSSIPTNSSRMTKETSETSEDYGKNSSQQSSRLQRFSGFVQGKSKPKPPPSPR